MSHTFHHGYKAKDRNGINDNWLKNEPKWHRKMYKHRPRRREWNNLKNSAVDWENAPYPLDKKPWEYYW